MAGGSSLEAVKKKIKALQSQADAAEERASLLQRELSQERSAREAVRAARDPSLHYCSSVCLSVQRWLRGGGGLMTAAGGD